jgi:mannosyltransferase OCH1-like enzyme
LLIALRQVGWFTRPKVAGVASITTPRIPKKIVQFWDRSQPPDDVQALMETWRLCHPEYVYRRFDDTTALEYVQARFSRDVLNAYTRCTEPTQRADIFRLAYLLAEGGYYADADDRCLARVDQTIRLRTGFVAFQEEFGTAGNNFLGCIPGHPIMSCALSHATQAINEGASEYLWLCSGPGLLTRAIAQVLANAPKGHFAYSDQLELLERSELRSIVAVHCTSSHKQSKRHWMKRAF